MNDDANTLRKQVASRFEASPTRYILIGIGLILLMILGCITTVWFVGNTTPPAPPPASKARVELLSAVQRNQPLAIRGSGFQPNERVEIYAAPGQNAGFGQMVKLGDAVSDGNGGFSVAAPYPQNLPDGALFVTAKGATTGFVGFAAAPGGAAAVPQPGPTQVPAPAGATPPPIPVQGAANLPDLAIGSLSIAPQAPTTCINTAVQPTLGVLVEIRNTTPFPSGPFVVQVNNTQYTMNNGLQGAGSITLWFSGYQTGINRVALDTANQVKELEETRNNVLELPLTVPAPYPQCSAAPPAPSTATPQPAAGPSATPDPNALNIWYAQYYNSQDLFEPATIRRYEPGNPFLNLDWRGGSPGAGLPNDGFSGALTRVQEFPSTDNYVFDFTVDDGGRLFIDGVLVIDEWRNGSARTVQASRSLSKGAHTIRIEFYEATGSARVALSWKSSYTGWRGRYYSSTDRTGQPVIIRDDRDPNGGLGLDLDWGFGSPAPEVPVDGFSVDWQRTVNFQQGNYLFTAEIDDGARIFIDGVVLIDNYLTSGNRIVTATRFLNAGAHSIQVQYVEYAGQSKFKLYWDRVLPIPTSTPIPATPIPLVTATPVPPTAVVVPSLTPVATAGGGGPVPPTALPTAVPSNTPVALPSNTPGAGSGAGGIVIIITPAP